MQQQNIKTSVSSILCSFIYNFSIQPTGLLNLPWNIGLESEQYDAFGASTDGCIKIDKFARKSHTHLTHSLTRMLHWQTALWVFSLNVIQLFN